MRCFIYYIITFIAFFKINTSHSIITPRDEEIVHKRETETLFSQPWENGLKEATYRVFVKEGWLEPGVKNELYVAPILGDNVPTVPFGDISMLARGQLYHNHGNLIFVRDKNLYDCENCRIQIPRKKYGDILTLWSVKRIRHRRSEDNFRYEVEYKISPILDSVYVKNNGEFNYEIPGHIFLLNQDIKESRNDRYYLPPYTSTTSVYFYTKRNERFTSTTVKPEDKSKLQQEIELYNKLLNSLKNHPQIETKKKILVTTPTTLRTTPTVLRTTPTILRTTPTILTTTPRILTTSDDLRTTPKSFTTTPTILKTTPTILRTTPTILKTTPTILRTTPTILKTTPTILSTTPRILTTSIKLTSPETTTTEIITKTTPEITTKRSKEPKITTPSILTTTSLKTTSKPFTTRKLLPTKEDFDDIFETKKEKMLLMKPTTSRPKEIGQVQTPPGDYVATATESYKVFASSALKTTKSGLLIEKMLKSAQKEVEENKFLDTTSTSSLNLTPNINLKEEITENFTDEALTTQSEETTSQSDEMMTQNEEMTNLIVIDEVEGTTSIEKVINQETSTKSQFLTVTSHQNEDQLNMMKLNKDNGSTTSMKPQFLTETSIEEARTLETSSKPQFLTDKSITNEDEPKTTSLNEEIESTISIEARTQETSTKPQLLTETSTENEDKLKTINLNKDIESTTSMQPQFLTETSIKNEIEPKTNYLNEIESTTSMGLQFLTDLPSTQIETTSITSQTKNKTSIITTESPLITKNRFKPTRKPSFKPTTTEKNLSISSKRTKKYKFSRPTKKINNFAKIATTTTEKNVIATTKRKKFNISRRPTIKNKTKKVKNQTIIVDKIETTTEKILKPEIVVKRPLTIKAPTPQTPPFTQDGREILDDIFGKTSKTTAKSTTKGFKRKQNADVDELFNDLKRKRFMKEKNKRIKIKERIKARIKEEKEKKISSEKTTPFSGIINEITTEENVIESKKIIFSNFYEASTTPNVEIQEDIPSIQEIETTTNNPDKKIDNLGEENKLKNDNETITMEYETTTMRYETTPIKYETTTIRYETTTMGYETTTMGYETTTMGYEELTKEREEVFNSTEKIDDSYEKLRIKATTENVSDVLDNLVLSVLNNARAVKYLDKKRRIARKKKKRLIKIRNRPKTE